jgi:hypothetical protein
LFESGFHQPSDILFGGNISPDREAPTSKRNNLSRDGPGAGEIDVTDCDVRAFTRQC